MSVWKILSLVLAGLALLAIPFANLPGLSTPGHLALAIFVMAALFWIFEPVPIYATSLLVIFLQIMLLSEQGALLSLGWGEFEGTDYRDFIGTLAHPIIILFLGGFMLAGAAVKYNLDRTLTGLVMRPFGTKPPAILIGLMLVTALLSAFMSNTATTAMMMTVILPVVAGLPPGDRLRTSVALAVPVAANVGGMATPIGTPPNAIVIAALAEEGIRLAFSTWMLLALPLVVLVLIGGWLVLLFFFPTQTKAVHLDLRGRFDRSTRAVIFYGVFGITVLLWMTEALHGMASNVVAFFPVAALPLLGILEKKDLRNIPWEVLWLVAGGISLGVSMQNTGLAAWLVGQVDWGNISGILLLLLFAGVTFILANFLSHTVTATLITPIALGLGAGLVQGAGGGFDPFLAGMVIAVASSLGMILPISTPPNAIAISTGLVETKDMAKVGLLLGLGGLLLTMGFAQFYWPLFGINSAP